MKFNELKFSTKKLVCSAVVKFWGQKATVKLRLANEIYLIFFPLSHNRIIYINVFSLDSVFYFLVVSDKLKLILFVCLRCNFIEISSLQGLVIFAEKSAKFNVAPEKDE